jgi:hypothetical protein
LRYGVKRFWGEAMELAILTVALLVAASQIPGDYHVMFFR